MLFVCVDAEEDKFYLMANISTDLVFAYLLMATFSTSLFAHDKKKKWTFGPEMETKWSVRKQTHIVCSSVVVVKKNRKSKAVLRERMSRASMITRSHIKRARPRQSPT